MLVKAMRKRKVTMLERLVKKSFSPKQFLQFSTQCLIILLNLTFPNNSSAKTSNRNHQIALTGGTNTVRNGNDSSSQYFMISSRNNYRLNKDNQLFFNMDLSGDNKEQKTLELKPLPIIGLGQNLIEFKDIANLTHQIKLSLPLDSTHRKRTSFITRLTYSPAVHVPLHQIGLDNASAFYQVSFSKGFYRYNTTTSGLSNSTLFIGQKLALTYKLGPSFLASLAFQYDQNWTDKGQKRRDTYLINEEISYLPKSLEGFALSVGHHNGGYAFSEDGIENKISLFGDKKDAHFYIRASQFL